jgi:hypothetical protein
VAFYCEEEDSHHNALLSSICARKAKLTHAPKQKNPCSDDGAVETNCSCIQTSSFLIFNFPSLISFSRASSQVFFFCFFLHRIYSKLIELSLLGWSFE